MKTKILKRKDVREFVRFARHDSSVDRGEVRHLLLNSDKFTMDKRNSLGAILAVAIMGVNILPNHNSFEYGMASLVGISASLGYFLISSRENYLKAHKRIKEIVNNGRTYGNNRVESLVEDSNEN